jgi:hypothetical protein
MGWDRKPLFPLKYKGFQGRNCEKITIKGQNGNKTVTLRVIIESAYTEGIYGQQGGTLILT